jgi:hypothetical protein
MIMMRASPQITMSFTPIDREIIFKFACKVDSSLMVHPPNSEFLSAIHFAAQSTESKKLRAQGRQAPHQAFAGLTLARRGRIPNDLL